ncbi:diguanylate cyclase [Ruminococcus sp.]|uniref:sensor domain-containing diguanylate cyclase n=1 Tax=Ruminococcus sp. TaxID=41978 RepID=UPI0025D4F7DD|nr:diguanylate cyclase [Ruminococcus sp.]MBQ9543009.1 diguanylate cyclase [Ruminococcus sp.]
MKQFQFDYVNTEKLRRELTKIKQWCNNGAVSDVVFQIYTETVDRDEIQAVCDVISEDMPYAEYFGCSTNGNIISGCWSGHDISIICTIFEYPTSKMKILQYDLSDENAEEVTADLLKKVEENSWVKAIELVTTIKDMSMTGFCRGLSKAAEDIQIFGGGAFAPDINAKSSIVFSKGSGFTDHGVVFRLLGGENLHITSTYVTGWKPLGKVFHVTRSEGIRLYEIDNTPAYEVYRKYLNIKNDEHFFNHTLEFPFLYLHNGISILRAPTESLPDGSLIMTSDMESDVTAQLAYGDPGTILESVREEGRKIYEFKPETVEIFSCAARRSFWGNSEISKESQPFQNIAPTYGFYTSGEFCRTNGHVNQHNVTMVLVGMREGDAPAGKTAELYVEDGEFTGKMALINRLANYINAAFRDLEEAAVTDGLTKLLNRAEIQRRIGERLRSGEPLTLIMIDIDNFKSVNDTYGHNEGDNVIVGLANMLHKGIDVHNPSACAGRWGGEEFMVMMPYDLEYTIPAARDMCSDFAALEFPLAGHRTISIGVTAAKPEDTLDELLIRVDSALYDAKHSGKNRFVVV